MHTTLIGFGGHSALLLLALAAAPFQGASDEAWDRADALTVRLPPSAFPQLPAAVRADLVRRGCTIPQPFVPGPPQNVISGRFYTAADRDWAILCSRRRVSAILIYRRGRVAAVEELLPRTDRDFLQHVGSGAIGYSRAIETASPGEIRTRQRYWELTEPRSVDHDGIEDVFVEKASTLWFRQGGRWLELPGLD